MSEELLSCPFCGGEAGLSIKTQSTVFRSNRGSSRGKEPLQCTVKCVELDCLVAPETMIYCAEEDAIKAWNTRSG